MYISHVFVTQCIFRIFVSLYVMLSVISLLWKNVNALFLPLTWTRKMSFDILERGAIKMLHCLFARPTKMMLFLHCFRQKSQYPCIYMWPTLIYESKFNILVIRAGIQSKYSNLSSLKNQIRL